MSHSNKPLPLMDDALLHRFNAYVAKADPQECWEWIGEINNGYGVFSIKGKRYIASRCAYMQGHGVDPGILMVCHSCDNATCCNPSHLWLGTRADNNLDCTQKRRRPRGTEVVGSVLTDAQVEHILADTRPLRIVAAEYGVTRAAIARIRQGTGWRHVAGDRKDSAAIAIKNRADSTRGEANSHALLTEQQVRDIRCDGRSSRKLAKHYNVSRSCIMAIQKRRTWAWLKEQEQQNL